MNYTIEKLEFIPLEILKTQSEGLTNLPGIGYSELIKLFSNLNAKYNKHKLSFNVEGENLVVYGAKKEQPKVYTFQILKELKENNWDNISRLLNKDNDPSLRIVANGKIREFDVVGYEPYPNKKYGGRIDIHLKENKDRTEMPLYILTINHDGAINMTVTEDGWDYWIKVNEKENEIAFLQNNP
jgi:hypothetical protein